MRPEELEPLQTRDAATESDLADLIDRVFAVIGERMRRVDGTGKVTGHAVYADDLAFPGMLHAKILRSPHPHARIVSIDTSKAEALPGVHAVVTGADMPEPYCIIPWTRDETALCVDKVRFVGDGVAAVDEDTAIRALDLIRVEYELLDPVFDPEDALRPDSPQIHAGKPDAKPGSRRANGNITKHVRLEFGEVDAELEASDVVRRCSTHTAAGTR